MKACSRCKVTKPAEAFYAERSGRLKSQCKDCGREVKRQWKAQNPERDKEQWLRWRAKQPEGTLAHQRRWYEAQDPERRRERAHAWREANRERYNEAKRQDYARNIVRYRALSVAQFHRRRDAMVGEVPVAVIAAIRDEPCAYCGAAEHIEIDHIVPLSRGGTHEPENLAPACRSCNRSKGAKLLSEWRVAV